MTQTEYLGKLAELFELTAEDMVLDRPLSDLPGWGSLTLLGVMGMTDEELGVNLPPAQVLKCQTIHDLVGLVRGSLASN